MVIWISGAYGVGKSTVAEILSERLDNAMVFDAEEVGNAVRGNYPGEPYGVIFEDYPLWADFCVRLIEDIHGRFSGNILVPMTLLRKDSYAKIIDRLADDGVDTRFVVLEASYSGIRSRILARGEDEDCWCMQNIGVAREGAHSIEFGIHIDTDNRTAAEIAELILTHIQTAPGAFVRI